jgi:1-acyl-sn-glycerol-3-phosphate acyltransferase
MKRFFARLAMLAFHVGFVRPVLYWFIGVRFRRRHLVPKGPCVVVSNHNSHLDAALLMTLFPIGRLPHVHPVAAADYFGTNWIKRTAAMTLMNGIPIERRPKAGSDPLAPIAQALEAGESLVFFPEGSRGEAGVVAPFRPGIGRLVRSSPGVLVVPVFLSGPERIWPRGEVVPVPLSIDVVVGRPKTYDPADDPKVIAEQVQKSVISLAPPPPPTPQPQRPPPLRVAVCGLDRDMRKEVFRRVSERLGGIERTLGITDPVIEVDSEGTRELTGPIPHSRGRPWLGALASIFRTSGLFKGQKFVEMIDLAQIDEALGHTPAARFVVTDGSALVDVLAWVEADSYQGVFDESELNHLLGYLVGSKPIPVSRWWTFIRTATEVWLINSFDLARPPVPDVLVNLRMPASRLMERLRLRGAELERHENEAYLDRLQEGYRKVASLLTRRHKVDVAEFDVLDEPLDALVDEVERVCRERMEPVAEPETEATPTS